MGLAVGIGVMLMMAFKITHPPAGGNPIIVMIGGVSFQFFNISSNGRSNYNHYWRYNLQPFNFKKKISSDLEIIVCFIIKYLLNPTTCMKYLHCKYYFVNISNKKKKKKENE